jgi:hypothetical protein
LDHAGGTLLLCSLTGFLTYLNRAPVIWCLKKKACIEMSTFGSEFIGLKTATDLVKGLRYKIQMVGIPMEGLAHMCVDNMSVVHNSSTPESTLKNKSISIENM